MEPSGGNDRESECKAELNSEIFHTPRLFRIRFGRMAHNTLPRANGSFYERKWLKNGRNLRFSKYRVLVPLIRCDNNLSQILQDLR